MRNPNPMSTIHSFFSKSWIWCGLTLVSLGAALMAVQQGMSRYHRPAVPSASPVLTQEPRVLTDSSAEAKLPQPEIPVGATAEEPSSVSRGAKAVGPVFPTPVSFDRVETDVVFTVSGQAIAPSLARAVKADRNTASVSVDSSGNSGTPTVDPPLVFTVEPKNLTLEQQTALAAIQDQFLKAIGDANHDPADPAYRKRWMTAQSIADQTYRALFGWPAFSQMQLERARSTYTEIQQP